HGRGLDLSIDPAGKPLSPPGRRRGLYGRVHRTLCVRADLPGRVDAKDTDRSRGCADCDQYGDLHDRVPTLLAQPRTTSGFLIGETLWRAWAGAASSPPAPAELQPGPQTRIGFHMINHRQFQLR